MKEKRGRGRPVGSGEKDEPLLADIADLLVRTPGLKLTPAARHVMKARNDWKAASQQAMIRRLQTKWQVAGARELAAAHKRAAQTSTPRSSRMDYVGIPDHVAELQRHIGAIRAVYSPLFEQAVEVRKTFEAVRGDFAQFGALGASLKDQAAETLRQFEEAKNQAFAPYKGVLGEIDAIQKQAKMQIEAIRGPFAALEKTWAHHAAAAHFTSLTVRTALG
ncbi:hypothetical protein LB516_18450 [Mesorhizobium sp. CO1-1-7]|uniref:hypothetical protein n=1 Tax=Mesorhizobium sp. CO1-1-7 TaxID=2876632 RepID=UPI001CD0C9EB|nr:hypothetical protein [Mesorhizobium sp. CO1-1-7]MBZ9747232.1 hypothetical protein [Mesorhizobium sp. CO1-1-7]